MDQDVAKIVKALAYAENGGSPNISSPSAGKTGEMKSIFQFTPDTWKLYAKQASGQDNLPMTPENEAMVVYHKVSDWKQKGYTPEQIASMWNAGEQRPDAYKQNWKGVNKKYGVAYDTPAYVNKVTNYMKQFDSQPQVMTNNQTKNSTPSISSNIKMPENKGLLPNLKPLI